MWLALLLIIVAMVAVVLKIYHPKKAFNAKGKPVKYSKRIVEKNRRQPVNPANQYHAMCMHCYGYDRGLNKTKDSAINNVNHNQYCTYLKDEKHHRDNKNRMKFLNQQYIHVITPL